MPGKEKPRKTFESEWNDQSGNFLLVADLKAGTIQSIVQNVLRYDFEEGLSLDSVNYQEYIVQMAQKIIKEHPPGFDINQPDHVRNLDPEAWAEIEDFIAEYYPLMPFLSRGMLALFGKKSLKQDLTSSTESASNAPSTLDGPPTKSRSKTSSS